ncbi:MAG: hypothetical protein ACYC6L_08600 [Anaerolineae bacterium]
MYSERTPPPELTGLRISRITMVLSAAVTAAFLDRFYRHAAGDARPEFSLALRSWERRGEGSALRLLGAALCGRGLGWDAV